ncbi:response regulator [Chitinimonas koreensis]|uniref:response regulator n=1 Tax=Chitinimonas koreensis TaxID=356302 RepID=UPI0003FB5927|nr:response regulator transcription factor [Chitinimonas koreensis]QNM96673.1 response regulator transcription factor [Chitinimonas koreensis]
MIRVLIAEDHPIVREGVKQLVQLSGDMRVVGEATDGERVLEALRQTPCDVLLLDLSMPGLSGLEALPRILAQAKPPAILVLSMHDEAQMAARALKLGAAGYATKASDPALLIAAIRKLAAGGRYIDPQLADRMVFEVGLGSDKPPHAQLSEREFQIFLRLVRGEGINDIGQQLAISAKTVSTHKLRLLQKLGLGSTAELVRYAIEHKLID